MHHVAPTLISGVRGREGNTVRFLIKSDNIIGIDGKMTCKKEITISSFMLFLIIIKIRLIYCEFFNADNTVII